jgi:rfaE bifunctional protein nucleotidyltransferase chain/domain
MTRLVVLGDTLLDVDVEGTAERLCPDAPAPVVDVTRRRYRPGGAGLTALLAARAGYDVTLVTPIGDDEYAGLLLRLLAEHVSVRPIPLRGSTVRKTRVLVGGQVLVRIDSGDGQAGDGAGAVGALEEADLVMVADYGRGSAADPALRAALAGRPVVWDPHPRGADPVRGARLVTPNRSEAMRLGNGDPVALRTAWGVDAVAITHGADGALLADGDSTEPTMITVPDDIVVPRGTDPCGAGDSFAVAAAISLSTGRNTVDAVRHAVREASRFVADGGAGALARTLPAERYGTADHGMDAVTRVRRRGGTVVATGGCFDLLHPGHLDLLRRARALGDALVVCVNSDESVARRKGPRRPVRPAEDRVRILAALDPVDAVLVFDEDTPTRLLRTLRPDVWVKGADYAGRDLPEAQTVRGYGGRVVLVPLTDGYSTTRLISAITDPAPREGAA